MNNNAIQQTHVVPKTANRLPVTITRLSDDAFYLMALASRLKKLLETASLQHFLATGESLVFTKQAS